MEENQNLNEIKKNEETQNLEDDQQSKTPEETQEEKTGEKSEQEPIDFSMFLPDKMEDIIKMEIVQLKAWAFIYMGLEIHPKQKKIVKDLKQAKLAIDSADALVTVISPLLSPQEEREFKILLSDLKMNFISKSSGN